MVLERLSLSPHTDATTDRIESMVEVVPLFTVTSQALTSDNDRICRRDSNGSMVAVVQLFTATPPAPTRDVDSSRRH